MFRILNEHYAGNLLNANLNTNYADELRVATTKNSALELVKQHKEAFEWIQQAVELMKPDNVHICDGTVEEHDTLAQEMVARGDLIALNPEKNPNSYLARSDPSDVARVEKCTYICWPTKEEAGPTNNWVEPNEMMATLRGLYDGCMRGRTMYVVPYSMGPVGSYLARVGFEITDSPYVVYSMYIMTRIGVPVLKWMVEKQLPFIPGLHSVGSPRLDKSIPDSHWPCNDKKYIVHFPHLRTVASFGSGYGGNALLGKKCFALRIASALAKDEGWLAEHMLILGITNPEGKKKYIAAAFPSQCGKTNLAMMMPTLPGWKIECVGDDIAWMHPGKDGRLYAINPENGFFGVATGTSLHTNPHAMNTINRNTLFTNVALTDDGDVWWEGKTDDIPEHLIDWTGKDWTPNSKEPAAHPNSRFAVCTNQCPSLDPNWEDIEGVPISAILFGGRRPLTVPLITQALDWTHGTFFGAAVSSQTTAAAEGKVGELRHDPFAMLPFCGYNMGQYFQHWLDIGNKAEDAHLLPRIFQVNWFRKDKNGHYMWPGFGDNSRVLKWVFERSDEPLTPSAIAHASPIGFLPTDNAIDIDGLEGVTVEMMQQLHAVDVPGWFSDLASCEHYFSQFGDDLPQGIKDQVALLRRRLEEYASSPAEAR